MLALEENKQHLVLGIREGEARVREASETGWDGDLYCDKRGRYLNWIMGLE